MYYHASVMHFCAPFDIYNHTFKFLILICSLNEVKITFAEPTERSAMACAVPTSSLTC